MALLVAATVAGCHKSPTDVCNKLCEKTIACTGGTTQAIAQCKVLFNCANSDSNPNRCTDESLNNSVDCLDSCANDSNCNTIAMCTGGCPKCVTK
ncbi:MAG: hypothetical protein EXR72_00945 [Myxococcales bacterium]|nr:hypothetical protein [Myxococcales bacterium]